MNLFVYYKLLKTEHPHLQTRIKRMQANLMEQYPDIHCELMKRPDADASGQETWMEIYQLSEGDFSLFRTTLDRLVEQASLPQPRRNEVFIAL